jgi:hypothetical protein
LVSIGGLKRFPVSEGDNVSLHWSTPSPQAVSKKTAWVFGDSFAGALAPYMHTTFAEVRSFWPEEFEKAMSSGDARPDVIIWVRVERNLSGVGTHPESELIRMRNYSGVRQAVSSRDGAGGGYEFPSTPQALPLSNGGCERAWIRAG